VTIKSPEKSPESSKSPSKKMFYEKPSSCHNFGEEISKNQESMIKKKNFRHSVDGRWDKKPQNDLESWLSVYEVYHNKNQQKSIGSKIPKIGETRKGLLDKLNLTVIILFLIH